MPVVVVMCSASDLAPVDLITPWSEAVVAAGVSRAMLVSDDAGCVAAAKAAGVKVLQHTFQVGGWEGGLSVFGAERPPCEAPTVLDSGWVWEALVRHTRYRVLAARATGCRSKRH